MLGGAGLPYFATFRLDLSAPHHGERRNGAARIRAALCFIDGLARARSVVRLSCSRRLAICRWGGLIF